VDEAHKLPETAWYGRGGCHYKQCDTQWNVAKTNRNGPLTPTLYWLLIHIAMLNWRHWLSVERIEHGYFFLLNFALARID